MKQIEHIVMSSLRACSQIDFIFCSNNSILKFYFPLAGGELLEHVGKLCLAGCRMLGFAEADRSLPELTVSLGQLRSGYQQTFQDAKLSVSTGGISSHKAGLEAFVLSVATRPLSHFVQLEQGN